MSTYRGTYPPHPTLQQALARGQTRPFAFHEINPPGTKVLRQMFRRTVGRKPATLAELALWDARDRPKNMESKPAPAVKPKWKPDVKVELVAPEPPKIRVFDRAVDRAKKFFGRMRGRA